MQQLAYIRYTTLKIQRADSEREVLNDDVFTLFTGLGTRYPWDTEIRGQHPALKKVEHKKVNKLIKQRPTLPELRK